MNVKHSSVRLFTFAATSILLVGVAAAQPAPPPPVGGNGAAPPGPVHEGFTGGLDIGLGLTHISSDGGDSETETGLAGLNFQLGGFVNPDLAIHVRGSGTSFSISEIDTTFIAAFLGVTAQYYVAPQIFVGGGLGVSILTCTNDLCDDSENALGLNGRAGYEFYQSASSAFYGALEITPGFHDGGSVTSIGFQVGWQHF